MANGHTNFPEALARLIEDPAIDDSGVQNPSGTSALARRTDNILAASGDARNDGITHWSGILADWRDSDGFGDTGFRRCFQDHWRWPGSSMQVNHFITAVDMGYRPHKTYLFVQHYVAMMPGDPWEKMAQAIAAPDPSQPMAPGAWSPDEFECVNLIIGHEKVPDTGGYEAQTSFLGKVHAMYATEPQEYDIFRHAFDGLGSGPRHDPTQAQATLASITIGDGPGNSMQDLLLSLFGFKFGTMIRRAELTSLTAGADWIRTNLKDVMGDFPADGGATRSV
jgi:hypothetical protein